MDDNMKVALLGCAEYDADLILRTMEEAVELCGGGSALDVDGKTVLLKPNVLFDADPAKGVTTNPEFVRAAVRLMKKLGAAKIYVGDSPGFQKPGFSAKKAGIWDVCEDEGAEWYDFSTAATRLSCSNAQKVSSFSVSDIVDKVDMIISLPKLKTHQLMYFTGAVKNQFGLLPGLTKSPYHMMFPKRDDFAAMLVDLHCALKPSFAFMDAIISMEGPGPGSGYPRRTNLILASSNLVALDITACRLIGYDPDIIPVNRNAIDREIWLSSASDPEVVGLDPEQQRISDFIKIRITGNQSQLAEFLKPGFVRKIEESLKPKPLFVEKSCIRCGRCVKICPAEALKLDLPAAGEKDAKKTMVAVDYERCIRCFCCHEVCPADAIRIKIAPFSRGVI